MKLYMKQKVFSWRDKFAVKDDQERDRYYIEGELLSWGKKLHIYDMEHREVAFIREKVMAWMPRYIVEIDGREVCQIVQRFTLLRPRYALEGLPWQVQGDFWAHEYTVYDGESEIMQISKAWFTWGDSYLLDIARPEDELLCLCVVLAVDAATQSAQVASSGGGA